MRRTSTRKLVHYDKQITVAEYAWRWLARKMPNLKPSTRYRYTDQVRIICAGLGHVRMARLDPGMVSEWLASLPAGYGGSTCVGLLRVLRTMTRDAKADLRLVHWACERVTAPRPLPQYDDEDPNALTAEQLGRMFVAMREHEPMWFPLFATMAMTGMRFAEVSALQWNDLDFVSGKISVRRNQYRGMISSPKTAGSRRTIPMVPELATILEHHRQKVQSLLPNVEWVFPSSRGKPHPSGVLSEPIRRAAAIACIATRITPHGLRRTLNTLALQIAPAETIRAILGHVTSEMTARYNAPSLAARRDVLVKVTAKLDVRRDSRGRSPSAR
jgi:integrase